MYDLVIIGCPSYDRIIRNSNRSPNRILSGPAVTTAVTASKLGIENMVLVGSASPEFSHQLSEDYYKFGIPEHYIIESSETCGFEIDCRNGGVPTISSVLGVPSAIGIRDIPEEFLSSRVIVLSPILQEVNAELVEWICNSSDGIIVLDPQLRTVDENRALTIISELYVTSKTRSFIDYIISNEHEAAIITGEADPFVAAEVIVESIADPCIITLDSQGSLYFDGKHFSIIPSQTVEECDIAGAEAAYVAGFAQGLLKHQSPPDCAALATAVAGFKLLGDGFEFRLNPNQIEQKTRQIALEIETR